MSAAMLLTAKK